MYKYSLLVCLSVCLIFSSCKQKSKIDKKDKSLKEMQDDQGGNYVPVIAGAYSPIFKSIDGTDLHLNIFYPEGYDKNDSLPIIIYFFGGAFIHGSPTQYAEHCKYLASRGMVAATADYRVISRNNCTALECIKDAKTCMRWVRENADSLGIHPNKIIMGGGSAGGFLCLAAAMNNSKIEESSDNKQFSAVPNAMVLINPVVNTEEFEFRAKKFPNMAAEVNPIKHFSGNMPPAIMFHGTKDEMSAFKFAQEFADGYKNAGNEIEFHPFEGAEHGFAQLNKNDGKYYKETLKLTDLWLINHGYLFGSPTIK